MNLAHLSWYLTAVLALAALLSSFMTVIGEDGKPTSPLIIPAVLVCGALLFGLLSAYLTHLPTSHWVKQSKSLFAAFVVVATVVTFLLVVIG
jgi:hypothetical protein